MKKILMIAVLAVMTAVRGAGQIPVFGLGSESFLLQDKPFVIRCGEMHFSRIPRAYWRHRLQMAKAMGLNTICAYLFWDLHQPAPGKFNWKGQADAAEFCRIAQEEGLYVLLPPGPYSCAAWAVRPRGPLTVSEYYPGWFDSWGGRHMTGSSDNIVNDLRHMLDHQTSFSIYMVHGGTTFGLWSGANADPYMPETSSYDYDTPISENGVATPKYYALRGLLQGYLQAGESLPDPPPLRNCRVSTNPYWTNRPNTNDHSQ